MKPTVSSMIAAKLFVSRCFPLVMGGNWAILERKSSHFWMAESRCLNVAVSRLWQATIKGVRKVKDSLDMPFQQVA